MPSLVLEKSLNSFQKCRAGMCLFAHMRLHGKARVRGEDSPVASAERAPAQGTDTSCILPCTSLGGSVPSLFLPNPSFGCFIQILKLCFAIISLLFNLRRLWISRGDVPTDGRKGTVTLVGLWGHSASAQHLQS